MQRNIEEDFYDISVILTQDVLIQSPRELIQKFPFSKRDFKFPLW